MTAALLPKRIHGICTWTKSYVPRVTCKLLVISIYFSPLRTISRVSQLPIFLSVFLVLSQQLGMLFVSDQTFQPWYYKTIPHHLCRNLLPGGLALNNTRVIF